jgi:hypothetical protein
LVVENRQDIFWIKDIGRICSVTTFIPKNSGYKQQQKDR